MTPPSPRRVHFEDERPYARRPPSWSGPTAGAHIVPFPSPPRRSDGALPPPQWGYGPAMPAWIMPPMQYGAYPTTQIHPLLDGEPADGPLLLFDISRSAFQPRRLSSPGQANGAPLSLDELGQQATHPAVTRMTITCDIIKQWPITLEAFDRERPRSPYLDVPIPSRDSNVPITVGDVLVAIHRSLQQRISHVDWARLSQSDAADVARAYTRRCRTYPSAEAFEAAQGVRRVDYLLDKYMFKGLKRVHRNGNLEELKLIVGKR
ncbi:hypothetical protein CERSUDRAFT_80076 [Gelatoporia subvermispora B]|uniref:DUF6699 domain-containing protein n=1 Tax=Ceriporiopsis subvermispora (strain B) TaxID=914234 RepID=M2PUJ1_CERS8|nr:hypothetical protein CERSUDRAFT_80076 [Gelatoporia subvermispora B]